VQAVLRLSGRPRNAL